ncbi:hypothetical protein [Cupriavidus sp. UME77]|uniref:hypothetical protein n=1 Tax=Cupriavidus sp. UME77 TaxID=1862321 RepID=UPI001C7FD5A9|nr:hypothetical protein [Cupriavidus sp. UME77]
MPPDSSTLVGACATMRRCPDLISDDCLDLIEIGNTFRTNNGGIGFPEMRDDSWANRRQPCVGKGRARMKKISPERAWAYFYVGRIVRPPAREHAELGTLWCGGGIAEEKQAPHPAGARTGRFGPYFKP